MKTYSSLLFAAVLFAGGCQSTPNNATPADTGNVTVNFQDSDRFTDARDTANGPTSQSYLDELSKYLKEITAKRLATGQKLTVTFTDIDLAGDIRPGSLNDVRIMKDIYIPRMALHFQLVDASGAIIKEGDRHLTDLNYQQNINPVRQNEPLQYDKILLEDWVKKEFAQ